MVANGSPFSHCGFSGLWVWWDSVMGRIHRSSSIGVSWVEFVVLHQVWVVLILVCFGGFVI